MCKLSASSRVPYAQPLHSCLDLNVDITFWFIPFNSYCGCSNPQLIDKQLQGHRSAKQDKCFTRTKTDAGGFRRSSISFKLRKNIEIFNLFRFQKLQFDHHLQNWFHCAYGVHFFNNPLYWNSQTYDLKHQFWIRGSQLIFKIPRA